MKSIILLIFTTLFTWANGSFYDLYAQNRTTGKPNLITADFIASTYATYKLSREEKIEESVLKPRVINFANYLYKGVVKMDIANKREALAYTAMLSLLAKDGKSLNIPDGYESLQVAIGREAQLIISANSIAISPISHTKIDYRRFRVPTKYRNNPAYFRTLKYAQTLPLTPTLSSALDQTIQHSERLRNLKHHIEDLLETFIGVEQKSNRLLPNYRALDYYVFKNSPKPSINDIIKAISPNSKNRVVQKRLLGLYSSYDYDFKIMQILAKREEHLNASKGYYIQSRYRNLLYTKTTQTKEPKKSQKRIYANIEPNLEELLNVMIEGALLFSNKVNSNQVDQAMIRTLKELRRVSQLKSMQMVLNSRDIAFLNNVDKIFLEIVGVKDRPLTVNLARGLKGEILAPRVVGFGDGSFGGRYHIK